MDCVKCEGQLEKLRVGRIEVDQCPQCSGIWFDFGELEEALQAADVDRLKNRVDNNAGHDALEAPCPVCGGRGKMVPVKDMKHGLHIDTCTVCYGHWLDGGELEALREKGLLESMIDLFRLRE